MDNPIVPEDCELIVKKATPDDIEIGIVKNEQKPKILNLNQRMNLQLV